MADPNTIQMIPAARTVAGNRGMGGGNEGGSAVLVMKTLPNTWLEKAIATARL
jgi:hypothetical protein